jgi:hypothetical protein
MRFDLSAPSNSSDPIVMPVKNDVGGTRARIFSNTYCIERIAY